MIKNVSNCSDPSITFQEALIIVVQLFEALPDDDVKLGMVEIVPRQNFIIKDNKILGDVDIFVTSTFNPFWFGKDLLLVAQFKDENGVPFGMDEVKTNRLNFTETERDERITIDIDAGNRTRFTIELFVTPSLTDVRNFTPPARFLVTLGGQEPPTDGNGGGLKFGSGGVLSKVVGGFFGLLTLCLLTPQGRK